MPECLSTIFLRFLLEQLTIGTLICARQIIFQVQVVTAGEKIGATESISKIQNINCSPPSVPIWEHFFKFFSFEFPTEKKKNFSIISVIISR